MSELVTPKLPNYSYVNHPALNEPYAIVSCVDQKLFDSAIEFKPGFGDMFIVSYPKNGTTWVMNIIYLMKNNGIPLENQLIDQFIPFLEFDGGKVTESKPKPRIIKTHLPWSLTPFSEEVKYVFIVRNPKDSLVSFYYHTVGFDCYYHFANGKFDDYFDAYISGRCDFGDYFEMAPKWYEESKRKSNIYLMTYEDLKNDTKSEILKLADFLGDSLREKLLKNDEEMLKSVLKHSSFKNMQLQNENYCLESRPADLPFIRKGVIGDWKNRMSPDQSRRIDERMEECERKYPGFSKLWSKYDDLLKL